MKAHVVLGFCLAIVAICYANSISNDFIGDDYLLVALNPAIRTIEPAHFLLSPFWGEKYEDLGIYRPLVILGFSIEYSLWQRWPPGFRLVNLLLHAINGFLVFLIVRSLLLSEPAALAAAAVFLAHPVHTESVVAIVGQSLDQEGQAGLAEQTYRKAVEDAQFPDSQLLIAWAGSLERTGQQPEAVTVYRRAAVIDPGNAAVQERLSTLSRH